MHPWDTPAPTVNRKKKTISSYRLVGLWMTIAKRIALQGESAQVGRVKELSILLCKHKMDVVSLPLHHRQELPTKPQTEVHFLLLLSHTPNVFPRAVCLSRFGFCSWVLTCVIVRASVGVIAFCSLWRYKRKNQPQPSVSPSLLSQHRPLQTREIEFPYTWQESKHFPSSRYEISFF